MKSAQLLSTNEWFNAIEVWANAIKVRANAIEVWANAIKIQDQHKKIRKYCFRKLINLK